MMISYAPLDPCPPSYVGPPAVDHVVIRKSSAPWAWSRPWAAYAKDRQGRTDHIRRFADWSDAVAYADRIARRSR